MIAFYFNINTNNYIIKITMSVLISFEPDMAEAVEVMDYWKEQLCFDNTVEPSFENFDTQYRDLSTKMCCLYIVSCENDNNNVYDETLVLLGQDYLDTIDEMIPGTDILPKTSHMKTFEYFKKHRRDCTINFILGFYFDTINGRFNSCVNGYRNYFSSRIASEEHVESLSKLVLPEIRRLVISKNLPIRCNHKGKDNMRCKRVKKGSFYCFQHQKEI
jgi:hypothetical protein